MRTIRVRSKLSRQEREIRDRHLRESADIAERHVRLAQMRRESATNRGEHAGHSD